MMTVLVPHADMETISLCTAFAATPQRQLLHKIGCKSVKFMGMCRLEVGAAERHGLRSCFGQ